MLSNFKINMIQSLKGMVNDIRILTKPKIFKDYFGKILDARQKQSGYNGYYNIHVLYNDKQALLLPQLPYLFQKTTDKPWLIMTYQNYT